MLTSDTELLQATLDDNPADWDTRLVLADRLAEQAGGECPESRCQRWMAQHKTHAIQNPRRGQPLSCYWAHGAVWYTDNVLPIEVFRRLNKETRWETDSEERCHYNSRQEAEADLAQALDQLRRKYGFPE
jgi:hypothetical protein